MAEDNSSFLNYVNSSGFAFQMRIEEEILKEPNRWRLAGKEHRWQDESGQSGYIDLLVEFFGKFRVLIECKKQKDKNWIFLKTKSSQHKGTCSFLWSRKYKPIDQISFPTDFAAWDTFSFSPSSYISAFCTMQGQGDNIRTLLEKTASELTHAAECLAKEELSFSPIKDFPHEKIYIPVIVTNATLTVCSFASSNVDISTGELSLENAEFETVPFIRFQKGLETNILSATTQLGIQRQLELHEINAEKERTVFVVNSENLLEFLKSLNLDSYRTGMELPWNVVDSVYYSLITK
jgi:hypothetical protein